MTLTAAQADGRALGIDRGYAAVSYTHLDVYKRQVVEAANTAEGKRRQVEAVGKKIDADAARNKEKVALMVARAVTSAAQKAQEVQLSLIHISGGPGHL